MRRPRQTDKYPRCWPQVPGEVDKRISHVERELHPHSSSSSAPKSLSFLFSLSLSVTAISASHTKKQSRTMSTAQSLFTPTSHLKLLPPTTSATASSTASAAPNHVRPAAASTARPTRRTLLTTSTAAAAASLLLVLREPPPAHAASDDEYKKETSEVIGKVRTTLGLDRSDPNVASAVSELREASNAWVAKYRREKELLGRASFRDVYSALNAVSGHYISFGPGAPIPAKRKARILEEVDSAEKNLLRGR